MPIVIPLLCFLGVLASLWGFQESVLTAHADIRDGDYDVQSICVSGPDPVFDDAVTGLHQRDVVRNARFHIHVRDLINDGVISHRDELYGRSFIFSGYWVSDENKAQHFQAYIPKKHALEEVTCAEAMQFSAEARKREYVEDMDFEKATNDGLGSSGSTPTHQGHRRGSE